MFESCFTWKSSEQSYSTAVIQKSYNGSWTLAIVNPQSDFTLVVRNLFFFLHVDCALSNPFTSFDFLPPHEVLTDGKPGAEGRSAEPVANFGWATIDIKARDATTPSKEEKRALMATLRCLPICSTTQRAALILHVTVSDYGSGVVGGISHIVIGFFSHFHSAQVGREKKKSRQQ